MLLPALLLAAAPALQDAEPVRLVRVDLAACSPEQLVLLFAPGAALDPLEAPVGEGGLGALAGERELRRLDDLAVPYEVVVEDLVAHYRARLDPAPLGSSTLGADLAPPFGAGSQGGFWSWSEVVSVLDQLHAKHPAITTARTSLGTSVEGRDVWAMKVSDHPELDEDEPEARFDSMHHAREPQSMQTTLWFLLFLLEGYGTDPLATYLVDERELWFVPVVNPDGYVYNELTVPGGGGLWRKNRRDNGDGTFGVDPNRNYPFEWGYDDLGSSDATDAPDYRGPGPASEPEVQALLDLMAEREFATALSSHSFSGLWLAPYGYDLVPTADDPLFDELGALATAVNGYAYGPAPTLLYPANGGTIDTDYGIHGTLSWTPEIGLDADGFWPPTDRIVPLAEENLLGFQRTALAAGAFVRLAEVTTVDLGDGDGAFEPGEAVRVEALLRNSGLEATAGPVSVSIAADAPGVSASGAADLGALAAGDEDSTGAALLVTLSPDAQPGDELAYTVTWSHDGLVQSDERTLLVGQALPYVVDDLEVDVGWTAGAAGDAADTGAWELGDPVGTVTGSGAPLAPEDDATPGGTDCWVTGNGGGSAGDDDVDEGPTTLLSPLLDLSEVTAARVGYARWYGVATNANDAFVVSISDDGGASWAVLEEVTTNSAEWTRVSHRVEDHVALTDEVRLRFVASDVPNDSLVEAAVDDLEVLVFDEAPRLSVYGEAAQGTPLAVQVAGPEGALHGVFFSLGTAAVPLPGVQGELLLDPGAFFPLLQGTIGAEGYDRSVLTVSTAPGLFGTTVYFQGLVVDGGDRSFTNRARTTILP